MTDPRRCKDSNRADRQPQQIAPTGAQQRLLYRAAWGAHCRAGLCVYHRGLLGSSNLTSSEPIQPRGKPSIGRVTDLVARHQSAISGNIGRKARGEFV